MTRGKSHAHVAFLCPADYSYVATQWAIWKTASAAVPLSMHIDIWIVYRDSSRVTNALVYARCSTGPLHPVADWEYFVQDSQAEAVVVHESLAASFEPLLAKMPSLRSKLLVLRTPTPASPHTRFNSSVESRLLGDAASSSTSSLMDSRAQIIYTR